MNEAAEQGGAKFDIEEIVDQLLERILDQRPLPLESDCLIDVCIQGSEVFMRTVDHGPLLEELPRCNLHLDSHAQNTFPYYLGFFLKMVGVIK